jgi:hypothetical protein
MRDRTSNVAHDSAANDASRTGAVNAAGQTTVPTSLLDAVMDVDAAIDDGGLELQDALARMHEELAPLIPGPSGDVRVRDAAPVSPEESSART